MVFRIFLTFFIFIYCSFGSADQNLGLSIGLSQDKSNLSSNDNKQFTSFGISYYYSNGINSKFFLGIEGFLSRSEYPATNGVLGSETYISSEPYLSAKYMIGSSKNYAFAIMYSPYAQLQRTSPNLEDDLWTGDSFALKFSLEPDLNRKLSLQAAFTYVYSNYKTKNSNNNVGAASSFQRSNFIPSIGIIYNFK